VNSVLWTTLVIL